jgi:hypothetical protein
VKRPWWIAALLGACSLYSPGAGDSAGSLPNPQEAQNLRLDSLADAYLAGYHAAYPVRATRHGVHDFDARFGLLSRGAFELRAAHLRGYLDRLRTIDPDALRPERRRDARLLRHRLEAEILELEGLRRWQRDPTWYTELLRDGLIALALVPSGPADRRLTRIMDRLEQVRDVVIAARENLEGFPRIRAEVALDELSALRDFLRAGLPALFARELDASARPRFERAQKGALQGLDELADRFSTALSEAAPGAFAWGEELLRTRLLHEEMIETPIDDLLRTLESEIAKRRQEPPGRESRNAAGEGRGAADVARLLAELRELSAGFVPLPAGDPGLTPMVQTWSPAAAFACELFAPGPFEGERLRSALLVSLPGPREAAGEVPLRLALARETYPGRYVLSLYLAGSPSKLRAAFPSRALADGWAHEAASLVAGESQSAGRAHELLELCRGVAALRMHARGMTFSEAAAFLTREAGLAPAAAEREARRAAVDPGVFLGAWGAGQIRALRQEAASRTGLAGAEFHRALLSHGAPPLPLLREILAGASSP